MADSDDERHVKSRRFDNQPYDEVLEIPDADHVRTPSPRNFDSHPGQSRGVLGANKAKTGVTPPAPSKMSDRSQGESSDTSDPRRSGGPLPSTSTMIKDDPRLAAAKKPLQQPIGAGKKGNVSSRSNDTGSYESDEQDEEDEEDDSNSQPALVGAYNPSDFEHLVVPKEIQELFAFIGRYTPQTIELEYKLKPFIPEFIPAIGDLDAFLKIERPDLKPCLLGLQVVDEPSAKQSDPTVLELQLRAFSKEAGTSGKLSSVQVRSIEDVDSNPKAIDQWIKSIADLHKSKPLPTVNYTRQMPSIESLMQEWPPEFERKLREIGLPSAEIECDLGSYVDLTCALMDIPVYKSRIQSLHLLFSLYMEFKNSPHFREVHSGTLRSGTSPSGHFMSK